MKIRTLVLILIIALAVQTFAGSCATRRKVISDEDFMEALSGTWINTDYGGGSLHQKLINHPDGTREIFGLLTSTTAGDKDKITILYKWVDSKGIIWYRAHWEALPPLSSKGYRIGKISDSGNTFEYIWAGEDYPIEEWEPDRFEYNYRIYYRQ